MASDQISQSFPRSNPGHAAFAAPTLPGRTRQRPLDRPRGGGPRQRRPVAGGHHRRRRGPGLGARRRRPQSRRARSARVHRRRGRPRRGRLDRRRVDRARCGRGPRGAGGRRPPHRSVGPQGPRERSGSGGRDDRARVGAGERTRRASSACANSLPYSIDSKATASGQLRSCVSPSTFLRAQSPSRLSDSTVRNMTTAGTKT